MAWRMFLLAIACLVPGLAVPRGAVAQTVNVTSTGGVVGSGGDQVWVEATGLTAQTTVTTTDANGNVLAMYPSSALALNPAQNQLTFPVSTAAEMQLLTTSGIMVVVSNPSSAPSTGFVEISAGGVIGGSGDAVYVNATGITAQTTVKTTDVNGNVLATYPTSALALYPSQNQLTFAISTAAEKQLMTTRGMLVVISSPSLPQSTGFVFAPIPLTTTLPVTLLGVGQGGSNNYGIWVSGNGLTADSTITVRSQYGWTYSGSSPYMQRQTDWQVLRPCGRISPASSRKRN